MDQREAIKQQLDTAYQAEQHLELQPTKHNVDILSAVMGAIQAAYAYISQLPEDEPVRDPAEVVPVAELATELAEAE